MYHTAPYICIDHIGCMVGGACSGSPIGMVSALDMTLINYGKSLVIMMSFFYMVRKLNNGVYTLPALFHFGGGFCF